MIMGVNSHSKLVLFVILTVAVGLILLFNVGVGLQETLSISEVSRGISRLDFSQGFWPGLAGITETVGSRKTLFSLPMAVMYSIGGISDLTTQVVPIIFTLANALLISVLASTLYGKKAGWLSAFLFITLPATLFTATAFPFTQPVLFFALCLLLVYSSRRRSQKNWLRVAAIILFFIIITVLDLLLALCLVGLILALQFFKEGNHRLVWLLMAILFASLIARTGGTIGKVFVAFYDILVQLPEMEVLLPIIFIMLILVLWQRNANNQLPLALVGVSFAGLLWRSSAARDIELMGDPLFLVLLLALALLMGGLLSAKHIDVQNSRASIWMPLAFLALAWLAVGSPKLFIPSYAGFDWISLQTLIPALGILPGPVFLLFLTYAWSSAKENTKLAHFLSILLPIMLAAALIPYTWQRWHDTRSSVLAVGQAHDLIVESDITLPIYVVDDEVVVNQLEYFWKDAPPSPVTLVTLATLEGELKIGGGYILYWEDTIQNPPSTWWQMDTFGALGQPRLALARALDQADASKIFVEASVTPPRSKEDFEKIIGAAINAGQPCLVISIWIESQRSGAGTQSYFPLFDFPVEGCLGVTKPENLLTGQQPVLFPGYNPPIQYLGEERNLQQGAALGPKYPFFEDPRVFYLEVSLDADSIYAYHVELRGAENLMPLYWKIGDYENYLDYGMYKDWTPLTFLISTYGLERETLRLTLSPFMYYVSHYGGSVELRNLQLFEVELETGGG